MRGPADEPGPARDVHPMVRNTGLRRAAIRTCRSAARNARPLADRPNARWGPTARHVPAGAAIEIGILERAPVPECPRAIEGAARDEPQETPQPPPTQKVIDVFVFLSVQRLALTRERRPSVPL